MRLKKKKIYIIGVFVFYFILYRREKKDERENKKNRQGSLQPAVFPSLPTSSAVQESQLFFFVCHLSLSCTCLISR